MSVQKLTCGRRKHLTLLLVGFLLCILVLFNMHETISNNLGDEIDLPVSIEVLEDLGDSVLQEHTQIKFFEQPQLEHDGDKGLELAFISEAALEIRNLPEPPYILGGQSNGPRYLKVKTCARFPTLYDIQFSNKYWQVEKIRNSTFYLFSAYYDKRNITDVLPSIRILAMVDQIHVNGSALCQLWFKNEKYPVLTWIRAFNNIWQGHWSTRGVYNAFLISCPVPKTHEGKVPTSVSVVKDACTNATNNLRVHYSPPSIDNDYNELKKDKFGVCVKGLDMLHEDKSLRLIEWIELMKILGADKIFFYEFTVHPNIKKLLDYYVAQGSVDVTPLTLPGNLPNDPRIRHLFLNSIKRKVDKQKNEVIPYNDCLYRNLDKYQYLVVLDTDEVVIPKAGRSWNELTEHPEARFDDKGRPSSSWCFRNVYFLDDLIRDQDEDFYGIPKYLHMLQHVHRSANYTPPKKFIKCFHGTERTLTVHNHFPFTCLGGPCHIHHFRPEVAHLQHYRSNCVVDIKDCKSYKTDAIIDTTIWKYKERLIRNVNKVFSELGIVGPL